MGTAGLEPATCGVGIRWQSEGSPSQQTSSGNGDSVLGACLARIRQVNSDLATVVAAWDTVPEAVRAGILAMVKVTDT